MNAHLYVLDSDVLITPKNLHYAFDICPGFWNAITQYFEQQQVFSIGRGHMELAKPNKNDEDLAQWVDQIARKGFFFSTEQADVVTAHREIMNWVQDQKNYLPIAKSGFASKADSWLIAYAKAVGGTVVTNEQPAPDSRNQ